MNMTPQISRLVAIVLFLFVVKLTWSIIVTPYWHKINDMQERIEKKIAELNNYKKISVQIEELKNLRSKLLKLRNQTTWDSEGEKEGEVAAKLQEIFKVLLYANKTTMKSSKVILSENENGYQRLGVSIRMTSDLVSLRKIIHGLENYPKLIFVDLIDIKQQNDHMGNEYYSSSKLTVSFYYFAFIRSSAL